jgi:hypothetical protein
MKVIVKAATLSFCSPYSRKNENWNYCPQFCFEGICRRDAGNSLPVKIATEKTNRAAPVQRRIYRLLLPILSRVNLLYPSSPFAYTYQKAYATEFFRKHHFPEEIALFLEFACDLTDCPL